ncbi:MULTISPECIES: EAL domain-containing protein [Filomicrobium]|uniref:Diguanylate cyclase (GGDEF) domain-containing protein n=1 Tax=Filomicrobium insigne TaxID=418854 RepID=A0A1H0GQR8_9HYPH|nr:MULTISPECIES: EAL domain-containing protein [Filomicrobium]MCV0370151.1 EAL domain-containing protein [Filomicrobium sp.]SDO09159.1 diguanylate cyclase (GGDEF) domain-containing protein [Filomicrobium insigne]
MSEQQNPTGRKPEEPINIGPADDRSAVSADLSRPDPSTSGGVARSRSKSNLASNFVKAAWRGPTFLGLAMVAVIWGGLVMRDYEASSSAYAETRRIQDNIIRLFEENVLRSIKEVDKSVLYMRRVIENNYSSVDLHNLVASKDILSDLIVQVAIMDENGIMHASSAGPQPAPKQDLSDRAHYRAHVNNLNDELYISAPVVGRVSKKWSVQITRKFLKPDGSFGGVVVASLNPEHFTEFYRSIKFGNTTFISIVGMDGIVRASGGPVSDLYELGENLSHSELLRNLHQRSAGDFIDREAGRLVTFRKVRGYPLAVTMSIEENEIYADIRNGRVGNFLLGLILTLGIGAAVARNVRNQLEVSRLAVQDTLTTLPNRRVFRDELERLTSLFGRSDNGTDHSFAIFTLDVDHFKTVNDTLGHPVGDALLIEVGHRIRSVVNEADLVCRLGGDEFAILVPSVKDRSSAEALAQTLIKVITQPFEVEGHTIVVTASVGIAIGSESGLDPDELMIASDLALYAAKTGGRRTYRFFHKEMADEIEVRRRLELELRSVLEQDQLELHYQPIVDLRQNKICGFEALMRWRHPKKGLIPPDQFISVAEETGLIVPMGAWALREACKQAAQWPNDIKIAVNLSAEQFKDPNLFETVLDAVFEAGISPGRLELEITESLLLDDSTDTLAILHKLRKAGIRTAMDDFGTGYSSLAYLMSFPFDKIKIDRSFVSELNKRPEHNVIVRAIIKIGRVFNMTVTGEGVETAQQFKYLRTLGCLEAQGYHISRPLPAGELEPLFAKWNSKTSSTSSVA